MKASEIKLIDFLHNSPQFIIPIYQRMYSWDEKECLQLWEDVLKAGISDTIAAHFIGSIVYVQKSLYQVATQSSLLVIDGQQRLTTITLLIEALARAFDAGETVEGFSAQRLRDYYLVDPREEGDKKYKLILSQTDRKSLIALLDRHDLPSDVSLRVRDNFDFFVNKITKEKNNGNLAAVCKGISKLIVVDISLSRDQDNPQLIFESLNSTGRELSQADLIRNFILMRLEPELQKSLYNQYWRPMEVAFGQEGYTVHFDSLMRHYLTVKTGSIPKKSEVYESFKEHASSHDGEDIENLVSDVRTYAKHYCAMALDSEKNPELKMAFHDMRELKVGVAYPLLLELYNDYVSSILTADNFLSIVRLLESYVFRRAVCDIPTNSLNKTFANFTKNLNKDKYLESAQALLLLLKSYKRFPDDEEFKWEIKRKDLYNFRSNRYWLRRIENHDRKERILVDEFTIEHIMPQNENLSSAWKKELGDEWNRIQKTHLHTLGNLTLTGYNSEYSDKPFLDKCNITGGFAESPLRLNKDVATSESWTEEDILRRAETLSIKAASVWPFPKLDKNVLEEYRPETSRTEYGIDDHPNLLMEPVKGLFDNLRSQVLALDPCVTETFLKLYIAYKAETNFVDVIPQKERLVLSINIAFSEISDPKGVCNDVTNKGRWGNGDVEVYLENGDDTPYIMGLIRQAFDKQMYSELE